MFVGVLQLSALLLTNICMLSVPVGVSSPSDRSKHDLVLLVGILAVSPLLERVTDAIHPYLHATHCYVCVCACSMYPHSL